MDIKCFNDYVYTTKLNIDLAQQKHNAYCMQDFIEKNFKIKNVNTFHKTAPEVTKKFDQYNYLMYPYPGMHNLYSEIKKFFSVVNDHTFQEYYIHAWLNVYKKNQYIQWHAHWTKEYHAWYGLYCIDVEPDSYTMYKINGKETKIISENNLLVISRSGDDVHKSSEWHQDYPRITVAFDILPAQKLKSEHITAKNYWIPI